MEFFPIASDPSLLHPTLHRSPSCVLALLRRFSEYEDRTGKLLCATCSSQSELFCLCRLVVIYDPIIALQGLSSALDP